MISVFEIQLNLFEYANFHQYIVQLYSDDSIISISTEISILKIRKGLKYIIAYSFSARLTPYPYFSAKNSF